MGLIFHSGTSGTMALFLNSSISSLEMFALPCVVIYENTLYSFYFYSIISSSLAVLPTSPDVPGLLLVVSSPVPSSFRARRNSLLRSGPRRISFSLDGAMSMGGVVLEGCCYDVSTTGREGEWDAERFVLQSWPRPEQRFTSCSLTSRLSSPLLGCCVVVRWLGCWVWLQRRGW